MDKKTLNDDVDDDDDDVSVNECVLKYYVNVCIMNIDFQVVVITQCNCLLDQ